MKKLSVFLLLFTVALAPFVHAQEAAPAPAEPTVEQRIADLEAYVNNGARTPDVASKIAGPGPGHNAWQMVSTALVLFMTLPGLALFYGGLVRSKNVLSILAMCLGIAGLVTIMWFLFGYSLTFSGGNAFIGDLAQACFNGMKPGNVGAGYYWISDYIWGHVPAHVCDYHTRPYFWCDG
jgi:Amt family ammonium transporter